MNRNPAVAGAFYPADVLTLKKQVASFIKEKPSVKPEGEILGLLVPHAGYVYSGAIAGEGFSALKGVDFTTAVIMGTGHQFPVRGGALYASGSFNTSLGALEVDGAISASLIKKSSLFENLPRVHEEEHSVEVQLPFFQFLKGNSIKIVPLVFNTSDLSILKEAGKILGNELKGKSAVVCVSSDLSHYPPAETARRADTTIMLALKTAMRLKDVSYFELASRTLMEKGGEDLSCVCCGEAAVIAGAQACLELGADDFQLLRYANSGDISGDNSRTVGYAAGLFIKSGKPCEKTVSLTERVRKGLLALARKSIENRLKVGELRPLPLSDEPVLNLPGAVFVTLEHKGRLRGCIGTMEPRTTLQDAVAGFAVSSAFDDPRFPPLSPSELKDVKIEISVLAPLCRAAGPEEIERGRHGVYVKRGSRSGTYLPQVWEHFGTREEFLSSLCAEKAGLGAEDWKKASTELYTYTVEAFEEE